MFALGKKNQDGPKVRIEHRGKNILALLTGGRSVKADKILGSVNLDVNPLSLNITTTD